MSTRFGIALSCLLLASPALAAGAVSVTPVTLTVTGPAQATSIRLHNGGDKVANAQVRVFAWVQKDGQERLVPATGVVASPAIVRLDPGVEQTVRIVRVDKTPVVGVESYRLLIDQLPDRSDQQDGKIAFVVRESIPVFFAAKDASPPRVTWAIKASGGVLTVTARNSGAAAAKIVNPVIDQNGKRLTLSEGLFGYVLGGSTMTWTVSSPAAPKAGQATFSYRSETGVFSVPVSVVAAR